MSPRSGFWAIGLVVVAMCLVVAMTGSATAMSVYYYRTAYGDSSWHSIGNGWWYAYNATYDMGYWRYGTNDRHAFRYGSQQWYHRNNSSEWISLGSAATCTEWIGDTAYHYLGAGYYYQWLSSDMGYWSATSTSAGYRYAYSYRYSQWHLRGYGNGWNPLGIGGLAATFMGDGKYHALGNGYYYAGFSTTGYWSTNGETSGSGIRYKYLFGSGQWYLRGYGGTYNVLGNARLSSSFMGDAKYHWLGNGYYYAGLLTTGYWSTDGATSGSGIRYKYLFGSGQWYLRGYGGTYNVLGAAGLSSSFMGDEKYHALGNGYYYAGFSTTGYWSTDGATPGSGIRYRYLFGSGQWYLLGYDGTYNVLGNAGLSSSFMGNGQYHHLSGYGADAVYYKGLADTGYWSTNGATSGDRYSYDFSTGQWYLRGYGGTYNVLGNAGLSSNFMGDMKYHALGNGYYYLGLSTTGYWSTNGDKSGSGVQYKYLFGSGQWYLRGYDGSYNRLGYAGLNSSFMGDDNYHYLGGSWDGDYGNGVCYYRELASQGIWAPTIDGLSGPRYLYDFNTGRWHLHGFGLDGYYYLSAAGLSSYFMGEYDSFGKGNYKFLGSGYGSGNWYYMGTLEWGMWSTNDNSSGDRYAYKFSTGQWSLLGYGGSWNVLGAAGLVVDFMGNGDYHYLGAYGPRQWWYRGLSDAGYWSLDWTSSCDRYKYVFSTGSWYHSGMASASGFYALGGGQLSSAFLGDGKYHRVGPNYYYQGLSDTGYWSVDGTSSGDRYHYKYSTGTWYYRSSSEEFWDAISSSSTNTGFRNPY